MWHRRLQRNKITDVIQNVICWPYRRAAGDRAGRGDPPPRLAAEPLRASRQTDVLTRFLNCRTGNRPLAYDCRFTNSSRSCFSSLVLDWAAQSRASLAYCRNSSDSDIATLLTTTPRSLGACARGRQQSEQFCSCGRYFFFLGLVPPLFLSVLLFYPLISLPPCLFLVVGFRSARFPYHFGLFTAVLSFNPTYADARSWWRLQRSSGRYRPCVSQGLVTTA